MLIAVKYMLSKNFHTVIYNYIYFFVYCRSNYVKNFLNKFGNIHRRMFRQQIDKNKNSISVDSARDLDKHQLNLQWYFLMLQNLILDSKTDSLERSFILSRISFPILVLKLNTVSIPKFFCMHIPTCLFAKCIPPLNSQIFV